jgi:hypothetical protein
MQLLITLFYTPQSDEFTNRFELAMQIFKMSLHDTVVVAECCLAGTYPKVNNAHNLKTY